MSSRIAGLFDQNRQIYQSYPGPLKQLRERVQSEIKQILNINPNTPLIVNGHQVEFFHPGILSKEIISGKISREVRGASVSIVLDHDHHDVNFTYPYIDNDEKKQRIRKNNFLFVRESIFYNSINTSEKNNFLELINKTKENLAQNYEPRVFNELSNHLNILQNNLNTKDTCTDIITSSRKESLQNHNIPLIALKVSELVELDCWKDFCRIITDNIDHFRKVHNSALGFYRSAHHIKNHAQPVPDLLYNELPFWLADNNEIKTKAHDSDIGRNFLPRAITLSIFLRLFLADIFIHGRGGGRYDLVTNQIIKNFFNVEPSAFIVKTATLHLPFMHIENFLNIYKMNSLPEWENMYRNFLYHPENILPKDSRLIKERFNLVSEFKNKTGNKKALHNQLEANRFQILESLESMKASLLEEKTRIKKYSSDKSVLSDRTFPFFFYDLSELFINDDFEIISYQNIF